jgi:hypothetical protein
MTDKRMFGSDCDLMGEPAIGTPKSKRQATKHDIEVEAVANGNGVDWEIDGKKPDESKLKLDYKSGGHEITFDLDRDHALKERGLRFNCAYPIFIHDNVENCPDSGVDEQIEVLSCSTDKLTIYDKNTGEAKLLRYQLNFVEDDGAQQVCDPIIDNGGNLQR